MYQHTCLASTDLESESLAHRTSTLRSTSSNTIIYIYLHIKGICLAKGGGIQSNPAFYSQTQQKNTFTTALLFWLYQAAWGILAPWTGIKPVSSAGEAEF